MVGKIEGRDFLACGGEERRLEPLTPHVKLQYAKI